MTANVLPSEAERDQLLLHAEAPQVPHIWRSYLAGVHEQPRLRSLKSKGFRQHTGRRPFPRLGGSRRNVTTTPMCLHLKSALVGPHRRRQSCRVGALARSAGGCLKQNVVCSQLFVFYKRHLPVRPLCPFLFLFLLRHSNDAPRREQPKFVGEAAGGGTNETRVDVSRRQASDTQNTVSGYVFPK